MDIQEATLIKRVLHALVGRVGVSARQLANECEASQRRTNNLALHLQNIGLIDIDDKGIVSLSESVAALCVDHVTGVKEGEGIFRRESAWNGVQQAVYRQLAYVKEQRLELARREAGGKFFSFIFGDDK